MKTKQWIVMGTFGALLIAPAIVRAGGPPSEDFKAAEAALFAQADADGNGTLSPAELKTFESLMHDQMAQRHFQHMDTNGDGAISLDELQAAGPGHEPGHGDHHCGPDGPPN